MDTSLKALCEAVKKVIWQLKPQSNPLSFILLIGKDNQGKTTLLRQSLNEHITVDSERHADIYYNQHGLILELDESWLNQSKSLLQYTLKQLNRCHRSLKISGIILCVDINELLNSEPLKYVEDSKLHTQILTRFGQSLGYRVSTAIIFSKLDAIAGFCEFYQNDHASELKKPLGFSLDWATRQDNKVTNNYKVQFEQLIEVLGQQVIHKIHPARSGAKRTLIRELPLQLASVGRVIQIFIQTISPNLFRLDAIYFTSGEQGGISIDRLNKKIQHEYALTVQDKFPQSINHRAYFIEGALKAFQIQTKRSAASIVVPHKWATGVLAGVAGLTLIWMGSTYIKSSILLDKASKELIAYDNIQDQHNSDVSLALYHLTKASSVLDELKTNSLYLPTIQKLKSELSVLTKNNIQGNFLPTILAEIEQIIIDGRQSQLARYKALKTYLMLSDPNKLSETDVINWFSNHWQDAPKDVTIKKIALLNQVLQRPYQAIAINQQIVSDVRNYLNALPASYLYYTIAKSYFPNESTIIEASGFELPNKELPIYFTKEGFKQIINKLPTITADLKNDNWVLARQDVNDLTGLVQQAYCYEYTLWWQNFLHKSNPMHIEDYHQAQLLSQKLHQANSIYNLVELIQQQTSADSGENSALFNQEIASKFTNISLISPTSVNDLGSKLGELEKFLNTLAMINDQGRTAFTLTKSRFDGDKFVNPLSALYSHSQKLPEPISLWAKKVADDIWYILINDSRNFINQQWQQTVVREYKYNIAKRYPFDVNQTEEVAITDFNRFFARHGILNNFINDYLKPFIDTSSPQWQLKEVNNYVLPIAPEMINELIRANIITNMFFPEQSAENSRIEFSLQKVNLDPMVANLQLVIGETKLSDNQESENITNFHWPQVNAQLTLHSIEGKNYELAELGPWAFFKILQKVNVLVDEQDSSSLQILFELNGNSGRYILKTDNQINPFIPGILHDFVLHDSIA